MRRKPKAESIFAKPNPYGYRYNVNSPQIRPLYEMYKQRLGERILSDAQRLYFEEILDKMREKNEKKGE